MNSFPPAPAGVFSSRILPLASLPAGGTGGAHAAESRCGFSFPRFGNPPKKILSQTFPGLAVGKDLPEEFAAGKIPGEKCGNGTPQKG